MAKNRRRAVAASKHGGQHHGRHGAGVCSSQQLAGAYKNCARQLGISKIITALGTGIGTLVKAHKSLYSHSLVVCAKRAVLQPWAQGQIEGYNTCELMILPCAAPGPWPKGNENLTHNVYLSASSTSNIAAWLPQR